MLKENKLSNYFAADSRKDQIIFFLQVPEQWYKLIFGRFSMKVFAKLSHILPNVMYLVDSIEMYAFTKKIGKISP